MIILQVLSTFVLILFIILSQTQWNNPNCIMYDGKPVGPAVSRMIIVLWIIGFAFAIYKLWT